MKKLMMFLMWLGASAAAVGVAWAGVSVVDNQVVAPPSAGEVALASAGGGGLSDDPMLQDVGAPTSVGQAGSSTTTGASDEQIETEQTSTSTSNSTSSSTTQPAARPTTSTTAQPTKTISSSTPSTTKTFKMTGGTAAISFSASGVEVLWATPNPGFDVKIEPESPGIKVEFRAEHHRSRVDAWWSGGPQHSIREEPHD